MKPLIFEESWEYELHLTADWTGFGMLLWNSYDDYSDLYNFLSKMLITLGTTDIYGYYDLCEIPEECNITVDGEKLTGIYTDQYSNGLNVFFGNKISGMIYPNCITLDYDTLHQ